MSPPAQKPAELGLLTWSVRECAAAGVWLYVVIKLAVFDVDIFIFDRFAPSHRWLLNFRLLAFLGLVAALVLILGQRRSIALSWYVLGYPLLLSWRALCLVLPLAMPRWAILIAFAPALHRAALSFGATFVMYTTLTISTLTITLADTPVILELAMTALTLFLAAHFFRCLRRSYSSNLFVKLTALARKLREWIENRAEFAPTADTSHHADSDPNDGIASFYLMKALIHIAANKVVAQQRKYDMYLISSWFYTVVLTSFVFAFQYFGLSKLDPIAFEHAQGAGFWSFWGLSIGILTTSNVSRIVPLSTSASIASSLESLCSVLILVILVFAVLTAARETFRTDIGELSQELRRAASACETRAVFLYKVTAEELGRRVGLSKHAEAVNRMRIAGDLDALPTGQGQGNSLLETGVGGNTPPSH